MRSERFRARPASRRAHEPRVDDVLLARSDRRSRIRARLRRQAARQRSRRARPRRKRATRSTRASIASTASHTRKSTRRTRWLRRCCAKRRRRRRRRAPRARRLRCAVPQGFQTRWACHRPTRRHCRNRHENLFVRSDYTSGSVGTLAAWVSPDPGDGQRHPRNNLG